MFPLAYPIPSISWSQLPSLPRLYILVLCGLSLYIVYSLSRIAVKLHSLKKNATQHSVRGTVASALLALRTRLDNVRQAIVLLWLLFGCSFLLSLSLLPNILGDYRVPLSFIMITDLVTLCVYGCRVFLAFLFLHLAQWIVASRLQRFADFKSADR